MASSLNILDAAEADINGKNLMHVQQREQFSPIISLWKFQTFKLNYLESVLRKFRENFATAAISHYLLLIVPTAFSIALDVYGST